MATGIKRTYADFTGVDFLNEPSLVSITRSSDALNVWKNYKDTDGTCIETRPGVRKIAKIGNKIYDGACGSAGFLVEAFNYLKESKQLTVDEMEISTPDSRVKIFMVATNEELVIVEDTIAIMNGTYNPNHLEMDYSFAK